MQTRVHTQQVMSRRALRRALRLAALTIVAGGVVVGTASAVWNVTITPQLEWRPTSVPELDVTLRGTDQPPAPEVDTAFTPRWNEWAGTAGYLYFKPKVKLGETFQAPDATGFRCSGQALTWSSYDGFAPPPGDITYASWRVHSTMDFTIGENANTSFTYAPVAKPCVDYSLGTWTGSTLNRLTWAQPLAAGGTQGVTTPVTDMASQWAFKKLGLPLGSRETLKPVTVAVIDSGLDYRHPHLKPENIWRNPAPGGDPKFPGDLIGWNFVGRNNKPWDDYGHGTFVAGLITAINPAAKIMSLKVLDEFGSGTLSGMTQAIVYAVERGARIINLSIGSRGVSELEELVVDYARARGVMIIVAAGNEAVDTAKFGPVAVSGVFGVAASDPNDRRPTFGNWGQQVALAAPGVDIVSLRARSTDFVLVSTSGKDYTAGANIVGADKWFFKASGTSFSAPLVAGAASLLLSRNPMLTKEQIERVLVESADDIETPGWDQYTGAGRLNITRALRADPAYYLTAKVSRVEAGRLAGQTVVNVFGTADGSDFRHYEVQIGQGEAPARWKIVGERHRATVEDHVLASIPIKEITARGKWSIRVLVSDGSKTKEARGSLNVQ